MKNKSYQNIIPIGGFCSPAKELKRIGLRDTSLPFDWVITDLKTINCLLRNDFNDLFNAGLLYRSDENPVIIKHQHYNFDFYHDFNATESIEDQLPAIREKYLRRIKKFLSLIEKLDDILFIHYPTTSIKNIHEDINDFFNFISQYQCKGNLLLVINNDDELNKKAWPIDGVTVIAVKRDNDDIAYRKFMRDKQVLNWINSNIPAGYPNHIRFKNRINYMLKEIKKKFHKKSRKTFFD